MLLREKALRVAISQLGTVEQGGNNHGPQVKQYLADVGLPEGYPWCDAFVSWCFHQAAGQKLPWESAGVAVTYAYAKAHGWLVSRPFRGDLVLYDFDADTRKDDHIGFVEKVLQLGPFLRLQTIEGNTSSGQAGSQQDGGGVYRRTRLVRASSVAFARVPGTVDETAPKPEPVDLAQASNAALLAELARRLK